MTPRKSSRAYARSLGRCTTCRRKDSVPVPGLVNCRTCLDNAKRESKYARLVAMKAGLCGECLKQVAREGKRSCTGCAEKRKPQPIRLEAAE